jgi:hypothetical protein
LRSEPHDERNGLITSIVLASLKSKAISCDEFRFNVSLSVVPAVGGKKMKQYRVPSVKWASVWHILRTGLITTFLAALAPVSSFTQQTPAAADARAASQSFPLTDIAAISVAGGKAEPAEYLGRKAIRLTSPSEDSDIFAYVNGSAIQDGVTHRGLQAGTIVRQLSRSSPEFWKTKNRIGTTMGQTQKDGFVSD